MENAFYDFVMEQSAQVERQIASESRSKAAREDQANASLAAEVTKRVKIIYAPLVEKKFIPISPPHEWSPGGVNARCCKCAFPKEHEIHGTP